MRCGGAAIVAIGLGASVLTGCGYHLVGAGGEGRPKALPAEAQVVALAAMPEAARFFRDRLLRAGLAIDDGAEVRIRVQGPAISFAPSAYDAAGAPTQYRLLARGEIVVERGGGAIWRSGSLELEDAIFAGSDPGAVETARRERERQLVRRWLAAAWARLAAGW